MPGLKQHSTFKFHVMKPKILFIFHEDTRTGAPNALLSFLDYVKEQHPHDFVIDIFVLRSTGGELETELRKIARNFYIKRKRKSFKGKILNAFNLTMPSLFSLQMFNKYDVIYGNTILTLKYLSKIKLKFPKVKVLLHVHESQYLTSLFLDQRKATEQFKLMDGIFTVSTSASANLTNNYSVDTEKLTILYPAVSKTETAERNNPLKGLYKDCDLILVNIGQPILTKGTDLIPQIANLLHKRNPDLKFKIIIVGVLNESDYLKSIKLDIGKLKLENYIELVPHTKTPMNYMEISDACLIPAREESFSLIGVQAAVFKKPIVAFKGALGISDVLNDDASFQAEYLNVMDFVKQIEMIYHHQDLVQQKTALANEKYEAFLNSEKVNEKHYRELIKFLKHLNA